MGARPAGITTHRRDRRERRDKQGQGTHRTISAISGCSAVNNLTLGLQIPCGKAQSALADRYTIEYELGAGCMWPPSTSPNKHDCKVALKVLKPKRSVIKGNAATIQGNTAAD